MGRSRQRFVWIASASYGNVAVRIEELVVSTGAFASGGIAS